MLLVVLPPCECTRCPTFVFTSFGANYIHCGTKRQNRANYGSTGFERLWGKNACILLCVACDTLVPIRTGLGTRAVLVGSAQAMAVLWNFSGWELGTLKNLQVLLVCIMSAPATALI